MGSLFWRIFLAVWGATALLGAVLVVLALTADPRRSEFGPHEKRLAAIGTEMVERYAAAGRSGLQQWHREHRGDGSREAFLFHEADGPLAGGQLPHMIRRLAAQAAYTGEKASRQTRHGLWLALPLAEGYAVAAQVPPPSPLERLLSPKGLALRLLFSFLIAGLVSYLLARSLSAPVTRLRDAAQRIARGDLDVRVAPTLAGRRDETAELARDFDHMTDRVRALLEDQQRLLRDISHELRSPLARLNVALELARGKSGDGAAPELDRIQREAERLNDLIGELLSLTRLEQQVEDLPRNPVDLAGLLREVVRDAGFEAQARDRTVTLTTPAAATLSGSQELLRRALENVVRNAARHTAPGTTVEVLLTGAPAPGGGHTIEVRDHGPGVPEETLADLFRPFYRADPARARDHGGSGLGLAIAERAVHLHGGTIRAENAAGGGLRVTIRLPAAG